MPAGYSLAKRESLQYSWWRSRQQTQSLLPFAVIVRNLVVQSQESHASNAAVVAALGLHQRLCRPLPTPRGPELSIGGNCELQGKEPLAEGMRVVVQGRARWIG